MKPDVRAVLAYLLPSFAIGYVWHLVAFKDTYDALGMFRRDVIIPLGFSAMLVQAFAFAALYRRMFSAMPVLEAALRYALFGALLSWSFSTLAVGAKNVMTSVPRFLEIETLYTLAQWALVAPLTVYVCRRAAVRS